MLKRILVLAIVLFSLPTIASAQGARCPLNTSSPALTRMFIPLVHNGSLQGVNGYTDPSQYAYGSYQGQFASETSNGMPFNDALGLLNQASIHDHLDVCYPKYGIMMAPIVLPFRWRGYHAPGWLGQRPGDMIRDVVFDTPQPALIPLDPMGLKEGTGHFTFDPFIGNTGPNIHMASPHGWTIIMNALEIYLQSGDVVGVEARMPVFTILDASVPEEPLFYPTQSAGTGITSLRDGGSGPWGSQIAQTQRGFIAGELAPWDGKWRFPCNGYQYGGKIGFDGTLTMRANMDLHNGNLGRLLSGVPPNSDGICELDFSELNFGKNIISLIWEAKTGPNGVYAPDANGDSVLVGVPNQTAWAVEQFIVERGTPAPLTTCSDIAMMNFAEDLPCVRWPNAPPPATATAALASVSVSPTSIPWNSEATGTVTLEQTSGVPIAVELRSFNEFVGVPGLVTIQPGEISATFEITAGNRDAAGAAQISATSANTVSTVLAVTVGN